MGKKKLVELLKNECGIAEEKLLKLGIITERKALCTQITDTEGKWLRTYCFEYDTTQTEILKKGVKRILTEENLFDELKEIVLEVTEKKEKLSCSVNFLCDKQDADSFIKLCEESDIPRSQILRAYLIFRRREVQR